MSHVSVPHIILGFASFEETMWARAFGMGAVEWCCVIAVIPLGISDIIKRRIPLGISEIIKRRLPLVFLIVAANSAYRCCIMLKSGSPGVESGTSNQGRGLESGSPNQGAQIRAVTADSRIREPESGTRIREVTLLSRIREPKSGTRIRDVTLLSRIREPKSGTRIRDVTLQSATNSNPV